MGGCGDVGFLARTSLRHSGRTPSGAFVWAYAAKSKKNSRRLQEKKLMQESCRNAKNLASDRFP